MQAAVIKGALTAGKSSDPGSGGVAKPPDGTAALPFRVVPEFQMSFVTTVPAQRLTLASPRRVTCAVGVDARGSPWRPMYAASMTSG